MTEMNEGTIADAIIEVLASHADQVAAYREGKMNSFGFLFGQVMKDTAGKADARLVNHELRRQLA